MTENLLQPAITRSTPDIEITVSDPLATDSVTDPSSSSSPDFTGNDDDNTDGDVISQRETQVKWNICGSIVDRGFVLYIGTHIVLIIFTLTAVINLSISSSSADKKVWENIAYFLLGILVPVPQFSSKPRSAGEQLASAAH